MENQLIGQKLHNISTMIQQQQNNQSQPVLMARNLLSPMYPPQYQEPRNMESLLQEQKQFKKDVTGLIAKLNNFNSSPDKSQGLQSQVLQYSPLYPPEQLKYIHPLQSQVQPIRNGSPEQNRQIKEQFVNLLRNNEQLDLFAQSNNDLKKALQQSNTRINALQQQLESAISQNNQLKQQLISNEQEKISNKRQSDERISNLQLQHQRELQQLKASCNEKLSMIDAQSQQKLQIKKTELEQLQKQLENKHVQASKEAQEKNEQLNSLIYQTKELSNQLEKRVQELYASEQALSNQQIEFERLQAEYNQSLEKYEYNTKDLIEKHQTRVKQFEQIIKELKQHNIILSQQVISQEQQFKQEQQSKQQQFGQQLNGTLDEIQKNNLDEKQRIQDHYQQLLNKLSQDKETMLQQKEQQILYLEQKVSVLSLEYKTVIETVKQQQEKIANLGEQQIQQEQLMKNYNRDNYNQIAHLNKKVQELSASKSPSKVEQLYSNAKLFELETQVNQKKEEVKILLQNLNQVIDINSKFEKQITEFKNKVSHISNANNKENEAYFAQIKQQKTTINELQKQIDYYKRNDQRLNSQIKELKANISSLGTNPKNSNSNDLDKHQELNKHLISKTQEYKQKILEQENKLQEMNDKLIESNSLVKQLEKKVDELLFKNKELKQQLLVQRTSAPTSQDDRHLEQYTSQISQLKEETNTQREEIVNLQLQLKQVRKDKAHLSMSMLNAGMASLVQQQSIVTEKK